MSCYFCHITYPFYQYVYVTGDTAWKRERGKDPCLEVLFLILVPADRADSENESGLDELGWCQYFRSNVVPHSRCRHDMSS